MRKMLFVYNPRAGKGAIRNALSHILEEFSRHDMEIVVHPTKKAGDAADTVCEQAEHYDLIVCSGGDGTLDEVISGVMRSGIRTPVGYIPAGSTNDFANTLGIPKQMRQAAAAIADGQTFSLDVGSLNEQYFIYVAAFGVFTEVSYQTSQDMKNMLGHLAYILEGAKSLSNLKSWNLIYRSDETSGSGNFLYGMVTNSNSVGGFKGITGRDVTLNDGLFEVTLIRMPDNLIEVSQIINAMLNGEPNNKVIMFKTSRLEIISNEEIAWTTDGEYGGTYSHVVIENNLRAVDMILSEQEENAEVLAPVAADEEEIEETE